MRHVARVFSTQHADHIFYSLPLFTLEIGNTNYLQTYWDKYLHSS